MNRHDHDTARDDDTQADDSELGAAIQLDNSETLEGAIDGDALDAGYVPPDRPFGLDDDEVNGHFDTLDERLAREVPDQDPDDDTDSGDPERSGRLVFEGEDTLDAQEVGVDGGAASAEEAAMHDVDGDTRVDGEPSVAGDPALDDPEVDRELAEEPAEEFRHAREDAERDGVLDAWGDRPNKAARGEGFEPLS